MTNDLAIGLMHQWRIAWRASPAFAAAALVMTAVMYALAALTASMHGQVAAAGITPASLMPLTAGLWAALALLPALGGGDADDPMAVAAVGGGRTFTFGSRLAAALADVGPGLFIPSLAIVGAAAAGWSGLVAGLALGWNGWAFGQLAGAVSARLMRRIGPTYALLAMAGVVLLLAATVVSGGFGPGAWWRAALTSPVNVLLLVVTGIGALTAAWALNGPTDRTLRNARPLHLPSAPLAALVMVMTAGIGRSVAARSIIITAALAPLLLRSSGQGATTLISFFVMVAAASMLGSNGFAYDGGAAVWLLGRVDRMTLLLARLITTWVWLLVLAAVAAICGALVGAPLTVGLVPGLLVAALGCAAAGLVPSVKRPMSTDADSFRTQSAPVVSALGTFTRAFLVVSVVLAEPLWASALVGGVYTAVALVHTRRLLRDPLALAALA